jgi:restriction system protein
MAEVSAVWVVRGGDSNELASQIASKGAVAIGWPFVGTLKTALSRDDIRSALEVGLPGSGTPNSVGQVFRFAHVIKPGDIILTPEKLTSTIHVSRCSGDYRFDEATFGAAYPHIRPVQFLKTVPRSLFPQSVRNTLGSTLTVFRADIALPYVLAAIGEGASVVGSAEPSDGVSADEIEGQANGQILEALDNIDHHAFQIFIAGLLTAMGYRAFPGPKGKDGGIDILAYKDAFGLESPRIKVQVKNQKSSAGIADVGYLNGVLASNESGLFFCTGGFTKDALAAPFTTNGRVALVTGGALLALVTEHYERFPEAAKRLLPLRRIFVLESAEAS